MISDCKSLYTKLTTETAVNLSAGGSAKAASIDIQILRQSLAVTRSRIWWVNNEHMVADSLTKASDGGARLDILQKLLSTNRFRITYCQVSGRREKTMNGESYQSSDQWYDFKDDEDTECYFMGEFDDTDDEQ